jgi:hypothetical protein
MERGIRQRGKRERQSNRLRERESEDWVKKVIAWFRNGHLRNRTPDYFYQCKSKSQTNVNQHLGGLRIPRLIWRCNILSNNTHYVSSYN